MTTYEYLLERKNNNLPVVPERIVCAANKTHDGIIVLGVRHSDYIMCWTARNIGVTLYSTEQGFYTNWERFVTREEAMVIAREQGQIYRPEGTHNPNVLYSEYLY